MLATTEVGRNPASQGNSLGEGAVWLMGALGGSLLGLSGLEGWDSPQSLSDGDGFESKPDGKVSASAINLLINASDNLLINDQGDVRLIGTPTVTVVPSVSLDMSSGLPAGLTARNGQTFQNVGSFTETIIPFNAPNNQDKQGYWSTTDIFLGTDDFDIRFTFAWTSDATGFPDVRVSPCALAPSLSLDGLSPYLIGPLIDRNNPLIFPGRSGTPDLDTGAALTNAGANYVPSGSELTADGTTLHTCGLSVQGTNYRSFFDGTEIDNFALTTAERFLVDSMTRIGVYWFNGDGETELHYRSSLLELEPAGTIYP